MKILVLNGPNMNLLGVREPDIYGTETLRSLEKRIKQYCRENKIKVSFFTSNHEGTLVYRIQMAYRKGIDGIVINPAAYSHTSIAIPDAIRAVCIPTVEVHISNPDTREDYRRTDHTRQACIDCVSGKGTDGYIDAVKILSDYVSKTK